MAVVMVAEGRRGEGRGLEVVRSGGQCIMHEALSGLGAFLPSCLSTCVRVCVRMCKLVQPRTPNYTWRRLPFLLLASKAVRKGERWRDTG